MEKEVFTEEMAIKLFEKLDKEIKENRETIFSLFFVGLISSDTCIDEDSCLYFLTNLMALKKGLEKANIEESLKNEYMEKLELGIKIVSRDLEAYKNGEYGHC